MGAGFVPVRKPGKLPAAAERVEYQLEYGTDILEIHRDAVEIGNRVLIVDDVLATGGTAAAVIKLVRQLKGEVVGLQFVIELDFLKGREKFPGLDVAVSSPLLVQCELQRTKMPRACGCGPWPRSIWISGSSTNAPTGSTNSAPFSKPFRLADTLEIEYEPSRRTHAGTRRPLVHPRQSGPARGPRRRWKP